MKICPVCSREFDEATDSCPNDGVALVSLDTGADERGENLIGQVVAGRYRLERIVGRGGMGTVYACRHVLVGKAFAMKVLRPGIERSTEVLQRFIREAQSANAVRSRHICEMVDFGQLDSGAFYVVMELLDGVSMTRALRQGQLDAPTLRDVFVQIAETLDRAHRAGIVHRDLKPDNVILVEDEGNRNFVKLVDFGIAKMVQSNASNLTETGIILGTPYYMSPEQARGEAVDARSDIYALGVMMYRAFTGKLPFVADTTMGVLTRHLTETPEQPSRIASIDPVVERVILRCMEKQPIDRFQSMNDVAEALRSASMAPSRGADRATVDDLGSGPLRAKLDAELQREGLGHLLGRAHPPPLPGSPGESTPAATPGAWPTEPSSPGWPGAGPPSWEEQSSRPVLLSGGMAAGASAAAVTGSGPAAYPSGAHAPYPAAAASVTGPHAAALAPTPSAPPWQGPPPIPMGASDGMPEAFTARGVVSSRIDTRQSAQRSKRVTIVATVAAALGVVAASAVTLLLVSRTEPAAATQGDATEAPTDTRAAETTSPVDVEPDGGAGDSDDAEVAPSATATNSASAPTDSASAAAQPQPPVRPAPTVRPPPPLPKPTSDIRSPFD